MAIKIKNDGIDYESIDVMRVIVLLVFWAFIGANIYNTSINTEIIANHYKKEDAAHKIQVDQNDCVRQCPANESVSTLPSFKAEWDYRHSSAPFKPSWDDKHSQCVDRCNAEAATKTDDVWR